MESFYSLKNKLTNQPTERSDVPFTGLTNTENHQPITRNAEHGTQNTERGTRNTEYGTRNVER